MFQDIKDLKTKQNEYHFMATVVGLHRETKTIITDEYQVIEVVDGQQRITTLIILLRSLEKTLDTSFTKDSIVAREINELLVKQDKLSLILLQTNHDRSDYFRNYIRNGSLPSTPNPKTIADKSILDAIKDCEAFVKDWDDHIELLTILKNKLKFIFHELQKEETVYTIFEVLNNRGLRVSPLDRLKSMLMSTVFMNHKESATEIIDELHMIWGNIFEKIGIRQGLNTEALKFAATLKLDRRPSKPLNEDDSVQTLIDASKNTPALTIKISKWIFDVVEAVDTLTGLKPHHRQTVGDVLQSRILATSILLKGFSEDNKITLLDKWEKVSFRVFGLCRKDARTAVGDYIRLSWDIINNKNINTSDIIQQIDSISQNKEHSIEWAIETTRDNNCYTGWENKLRYLLFCYEEHLAKIKGQEFENEQWNRIWEASASKSIEHIYPQSRGTEEQSGEGVFVHRLGNLMLLPPGVNSSLNNRDPLDKVQTYEKTGLYSANEVAATITHTGSWGSKEIEDRENKILEWIKTHWG